VFRSNPGSVNKAPEVGFEQPAGIFDRLLQQRTIDGHASVVDPGIEASEVPYGFSSESPNVLFGRHVANNVAGLTSPCSDLIAELPQRILVPCGDNDFRAAFCRLASGGKADSA